MEAGKRENKNYTKEKMVRGISWGKCKMVVVFYDFY